MLRFDAEQRFTCQQCARCCRRGWDIALTPGEVEVYRQARAERLFRETENAPAGAERDPFEPIPGLSGQRRIRKRADGVCGFLSPENRCRIHEELGGALKPLSCRLFPFRFHPAEGPPLVTTSFSCPTIVSNVGTPLGSQLRELGALEREWRRESPASAVALHYVAGRELEAGSLRTLREALRQILEHGGSDGRVDLRANADRLARTLEDLARWRVVRLAPVAFAEYLELTVRHAASSDRPLTPRAPSRLARLLFRGFLLAAVAARLQRGSQPSGLRIGLRLRLVALALHLNGLGPALAGVDLGAARRSRLDLDEAETHALAHHYLRAAIATSGTAERPLLDELAVSVAVLNAAGVLAAMRAGTEGRAAQAADLMDGLVEASDLTHTAPSGALGRLLPTLAGGVEAFYLFASGLVFQGTGVAAEV